jgi:hypothetical protein
MAQYASQGKGPSTVARDGMARGWECLSVRSNEKAGWLTDRLVFGFGVAVERCDSSCLAAAFTGQRAGWISKPTT